MIYVYKYDFEWHCSEFTAIQRLLIEKDKADINLCSNYPRVDVSPLLCSFIVSF